MCYCNPHRRTPFCSSITCQEELIKYRTNALSDPAYLQEKGFRLREARDKADKELIEFQKTCPHLKDFVTVTHESSGFMYDEQAWTNHSCSLCGFHWSEDN